MMNQPRRLMFVGSAHVRTIEECCEAGLRLSQLSEYDVTREFILMDGWESTRARLSNTNTVSRVPHWYERTFFDSEFS